MIKGNFQGHGFEFEDMIIKNITNLESKEYKQKQDGKNTAKYDIESGILSEENYSIKVSKNGNSVCCSDIIRFFDSTKNDKFKMVVGCWKQKDKTTKVYDKVIEIEFTEETHLKLWGRLSRNDLTNFVEYVKSIPYGPVGQSENKKLWKEKRDRIYDDGIMSINAKIDSKTQRRVQCSFKLQDLIDNGFKCEVFENNYQGLKLPYEQKSTERQF
jgi:hypothetical protein